MHVWKTLIMLSCAGLNQFKYDCHYWKCCNQKRKQSIITIFLWPFSVKVQNLLKEKSYRAPNGPRRESFQNSPKMSFSILWYDIWDLFRIWTSSTPIFLVSLFQWKMYQGWKYLSNVIFCYGKIHHLAVLHFWIQKLQSITFSKLCSELQCCAQKLR